MHSSVALRVSILLGQDDMWHHRPLYHEIVKRARDAGVAGASVWRGVEGYGHSSRIHTSRILDLAESLPTLVVIIDEPDRLRSFLSDIAELLTEATVTLDEVERVQFGGEQGEGQ